METGQSGRRRRHHPEAFKLAVLEACCKPGASLADVALAHEVNTDQIRRWMRERGIEVPRQRVAMPRIKTAAGVSPEFVPLSFSPEDVASRDIRIEIRRGNTAIRVGWPVKASGDCATWLRDWLK